MKEREIGWNPPEIVAGDMDTPHTQQKGGHGFDMNPPTHTHRPLSSWNKLK